MSEPDGRRTRLALVADRSPTLRQSAVRQLSLGDGWRCETAASIREARDKIVLLRPTILVVEAEMPGNESGQFVERLMRYHPMPVMVLARMWPAAPSSTPLAGPSSALVVLRAGSDEMAGEAVARAVRAWGGKGAAARTKPAAYKMIAIGASTGGTEAVEHVLRTMPEDSPGIVVAQHIPRQFSSSFAARLNRVTAVDAREAVDGDVIRDGLALVAPGDRHMRVVQAGPHWEVRLDAGPKVWYQRPSVDVLFSSVAAHAGGQAVGVLLTGMGQDGAAGLLEMRQAGCWTIAQDEASCVVFGMPRAAIAAGGACEVVSLDRMGAAIALQFRGGLSRLARG